MKVCPVCKSRCFDDMDTCYGCMYRFESKKEEVKPLQNKVVAQQKVVAQVQSKKSQQTKGQNPHQNMWTQVPANCVQAPAATERIPAFHYVEDNVDRYIMLEDVEQFLSRRLEEDDSSIVFQNKTLQSDSGKKSIKTKPKCKTLTLTLEIPQEAMSMLVC